MSSVFKPGTIALTASILSLLAACSGGGGTGSGGSGGMGTTSSSSTGKSSTTSTTSTGTSAMPTFVAHFDPTKGELPEGLFIKGNTAYVGYAALGKIEKVDLTTGTVSDFGSIPQPTVNAGFMLGIVVDSSDNVYVGLGADPTVPNGIYKIPAAGGAVMAPWATDPGMNFPNGLIFNSKGKLAVADSGGTIFEIDPATAAVSKWSTDPLLGGTGSTCMYMAPFALGANGIVEAGGAYYVSNTNYGSIIKIPIDTDGTAGTASAFIPADCNGLGGIDGIAIDPGDGSMYALLNSQAKLIEIDVTAATKELASGMPLDNPASISVATVGGKKSVYFTNSALFDMATPVPGLLAYPLN